MIWSDKAIDYTNGGKTTGCWVMTIEESREALRKRGL